MTAATTGKTHRSPDHAYASVGAVHQTGGSLPIYVCNTCGRDVVWAESHKTGRKYLANVHHGYMGARFYIAASLHGPTCDAEMARREQALRDAETNAHYQYLFSLIDEHDEQGHPSAVPMCIRCERAGVSSEEVVRDLGREALS